MANEDQQGAGGNAAGRAASAAAKKAGRAAVKAMVKKVGTAVFVKLGGWIALIVVVVTLLIFLLVGFLVQPPANALNGDCAAGGAYKPNAPGVFGPNPTVVAVFYEVAKQKNADARAQLALFEAALAESGFRNLASQKIPASFTTKNGYDKWAPGVDAPPGDHMSIGVLQQQVGMGWGTVDQIMDPAHAAGIFLDRAIAVEAKTGGDAANLAQAVQASAYSDGSNYRAQQSAAQAWLSKAQTGNLSGGTGANGVTCGAGGQLLVTNGFVTFTSPDGNGACGSPSPMGPAGTPNEKYHMAVPVGEAGKAMVAAVTQVDEKWCYSWGGGTYRGASLGIAQGANIKGFDCSGLTMYAVYQGTGGRIKLDHLASDQAHMAGVTPEPVGSVRPGDLIFYDNPIGHVVMYLGKFTYNKSTNTWTSTNNNTGTPMVAEAPTTGNFLHIRQFNDGWTPSAAARPNYKGSVAA